MSEVVIVAIGRTPIGRAIKGSLIDERPDDLGAYVVDEVLKQVPQLDRGQIEDVICGCALPGGEQGHNLGRIISILAGVNAPGTTVNRYCASSLQAVRMAFHAIKADEGSAFLCVGVESSTRSPLGKFADQPETQNPRLLAGEPGGLPRGLHEHGRDGRERGRQVRHHARGDGPVRPAEPARAVAATKDGIFAREIIPVPLPSGITMTSDDGPRPDTTLERLASLQAGVPRERPGDRGERLPAQRRGGGGRGDVAGARRPARDRAARAHRVDRRQLPGARADGPGPDRVQPAGAGAGPG